MKKITAHKNECPVSAGQIVKTILKSATGIIATCTRIATADVGLSVAFAAIATQAVLMAAKGVL